jgi:hypothetical protein
MQPPSRRRRGTAVAPALLVALAVGCGSSGQPIQPIDGAVDRASDGHTDAAHTDAAHTDAVADVSIAGHCCSLQLGDGSSPLCGALNMDAAPGLVEACLSANSHGTYGRWTCGTGAEPPVCSDNGLSCGLGEPCTLVDVGCPGIVQTCNFKPYTPPPG